MNRRRLSLVIMAGTLLIAGGMAAGAPRSEDAAQVTLHRVERGDVEQLLLCAGMLRYEVEYAAMIPATGVVEQVYVQPGQRVCAGDALLRMDGAAQARAVSAALAGQGSLSAWTGVQPGAEASALLAGLTLRAAADGVVQQVSVTPHAGVMAGQAAMLLSGGGQLVQCSVVMRDASQLRRGMSARVTDGGELVTMAVVEHIGAAQVNAAGQTVCEVRLVPEGSIRLPLGAPLDVEIILAGAKDVPVLPLSAVDEEGMVWWVADGRSYRMPAGVALKDDVSCWVALPEGVEVASGDGLCEGGLVREMKP